MDRVTAELVQHLFDAFDVGHAVMVSELRFRLSCRLGASDVR